MKYGMPQAGTLRFILKLTKQLKKILNEISNQYKID